MIRGVVLTHGHEDHVGSLPYLMREVKIPVDRRDAADARAREVEARRARPAARSRPARGLARTTSRSISARSASSSSAWRIRSRTLPPSSSRRRAAGSCTPATTRSTTRRSTASAPTSASSPRSATAASICCSATRRTPSAPGVTQSETRRRRGVPQIFPSRKGRILVSSFASNVHRMQQAVDVGIECGRKVAFVGRSMRKNSNIARNLGYMDVPDDVILRPNELAELPPRAAAHPLHRQPGRADVGDDAHRLQRPSAGVRSKRATR